MAAALVLAGGQFTHTGEIHAGTGHHGHNHDISEAAFNDIGAGYIYDQGRNGGIPANRSGSFEADAGMHCGAPLMAVFDQDIEIVPVPPHLAIAGSVNPILTAQLNPDPPPPRT